MGPGPGNSSGHWEPDALVAYNDRLLAAAGSSWRDWGRLDLSALGPGRRSDVRSDLGEIIDADYGDASLVVIKDPRTCRFAGLMMDALDSSGIEPAPILMLRNPLEVVHSLEERDGMGRAEAALLWLRHMIDAEVATRNCRRAISTYDGLMSDWAGELDRISNALSMSFPYCPDEFAEIVDGFLDNKLRHHKYGIDAIAQEPVLHGWVSDVYAAMCVLSKSPQSSTAFAELDRVRRAFDGACLNLKALIAATEAAGCARAQSEINAVREQLAQSERRSHRVPQLEAQLIDAEKRAVANADRQSALQVAVDDLRELLSRRGAALEILANLDKAAGEPSRFPETLCGISNALLDRIADIEAELAETNIKNDAYELELIELRKEATHLTDARSREIDRHEAVALELHEELQSIHSDLALVRTEYLRAQRERADLDGKLRAALDQVEALSEQLAQSEAAQSALTSNMGETTQSLEAEKTRNQQLGDHVARQAREIEATASHIHQAYQSSTSWRLTAPVRTLKRSQLAVDRLFKIVPTALRHGGGIVSTARKAIRIYRSEGVVGVQNRIFLVQHMSGMESAEAYHASLLRPSAEKLTIGSAIGTGGGTQAAQPREPGSISVLASGGSITAAMTEVRLAMLEELRPLGMQSVEWAQVNRDRLVSAEEFRRALVSCLDAANDGLIVSLTHDNYTKIAGGIQLCVQVEEQAFRDDGFAYLCLYPRQPLPQLSPVVDPNIFVFRAVLDGREIGSVSAQALLEALIGTKANARARGLVIHSLLGHSPEIVTELARSIGFACSVFWVHDFFSLCPNYTLLRNRISFCGAPRLGSNACEVCVFGAERAQHMERIEKLFSEIDFEVVAPSQAAADFWQSATGRANDSCRVVPHLELVDAGSLAPRAAADTADPIRIAFLGYPGFHKGWLLFTRLAAELKKDKRYRFYYFGVDRPSHSNIRFVRVQTTQSEPEAMVKALRKHRIDVAFLWSIWFETYSFTAHEAIASGAMIVTNSASGNIGRVVDDLKAGWVFENEAALFASFIGQEFANLVSARRSTSVPVYSKRFSSMSRHVIQ